MTHNLFKIGGLVIFILHLLWLLIYYYYGAIKIYNLTEKKQYQYVGCLWIRKVKGEYLLKIPQEMLDQSYTTQYRIVPENLFLKGKEGENLRLCFGSQYYTTIKVEKEISVKNHIATSNQL